MDFHDLVPLRPPSGTKHCLLCHLKFLGHHGHGGGNEETDALDPDGLRLIHKLFELEDEEVMSSSNLVTISNSNSFLDSTSSFCISCSFKVGILVGLWKDLEGLQRRIHGIRLEFLQVIQRTITQCPPGGPHHDLKLKVIQKSDLENWRVCVQNETHRSHFPHFQPDNFILDEGQLNPSTSENRRIVHPPVFSNVQLDVPAEPDPGVNPTVTEDMDHAQNNDLNLSPGPTSPTSSYFKSRKSSSSESESDQQQPSTMAVRRSGRARKPKVIHDDYVPPSKTGNTISSETNDPTPGSEKTERKRRSRPPRKINGPSASGVKGHGGDAVTPNPNNSRPDSQGITELVSTETETDPVVEPTPIPALSTQTEANPEGQEVKDAESGPRTKSKRINKCQYCGKVFKSGFYLKTHTYIHTGERPFKCDFCPKTFKADNAKKKHEVIHESIHTSTKKVYKCDLCSYATLHVGGIARHLRYTHNRVPIRRENPKTQCDICGVSLKRTSLLNHLRTYCGGIGEIPCKICGKPMEGRQMTWHLKTHNPPRGLVPVFICKECPDEVHFSDIEPFKTHLTTYHGMDEADEDPVAKTIKIFKKYYCSDCPGLFYKTSYGLQRHVARGHVPGGVKPKKRIQVWRGIKRPPTLNSENDQASSTEVIEIPDTDDPFPCPHKGCLRAFKCIQNVKKHFIVHHPDSDLEKTVYYGVEVVIKHPCQDCAATPAFETPAELLLHYEMMHSGEKSAMKKPVICPDPDCSAEFMFLWDLRAHFLNEHPKSELQTMEIEGKVHPILFRCVQCPVPDRPVFTGIAGLRIHFEKVHMTEQSSPDLQCPSCDTPAFLRLKDLQAHLSQTHKSANDKSWIQVDGHPLPLQILCPNCPFNPGFPDMTKLAEHMTFGIHAIKIPGSLNPGFKCPECDVSRTIVSLIRHFWAEHPTSTNHIVEFQGVRFSLIHKCMECELPPFKTRPLLEKHMSRLHLSGPGFLCKKCPELQRVFKSRFRFLRHSRTFHDPPRAWEKKHKKVNEDDEASAETEDTDSDEGAGQRSKPISTKQVRKPKSSSLLCGLKTSTLPPLICPEAETCGSKPFKNISDLRVHFCEAHRSSDNFWFDAKFRKIQLMFKCPHCPQSNPYASIRESKLQEHIRNVHKNKRSKGKRNKGSRTTPSTNRPLICPEKEICGSETFRTLTALRVHFSNHHPDSGNSWIADGGSKIQLIFKCPDCPDLSPFVEKSKFQRHARSVHGKGSDKGQDVGETESESESISLDSEFDEEYEDYGGSRKKRKEAFGGLGVIPGQGQSSRPWTLRQRKTIDYSSLLGDEGEEVEGDGEAPEGESLAIPSADNGNLRPDFKCPHCPDRNPFIDKSKLERHIRQVHETVKVSSANKTLLICPENQICGSETFKSLTDLRLHFREEHPDSDNCWTGTGTRRVKLVFKCSDCPDLKPFAQESQYQRHVRNFHGRRTKAQGSPKELSAEPETESGDDEDIDDGKRKGSEAEDEGQGHTLWKGLNRNPWNLRQRKRAKVLDQEEGGTTDIPSQSDPVILPPMTPQEQIKGSPHTTPIKPGRGPRDSSSTQSEPMTLPSQLPSTEDIDIKYETFHFDDNTNGKEEYSLSTTDTDPLAMTSTTLLSQPPNPHYCPLPIPLPILLMKTEEELDGPQPNPDPDPNDLEHAPPSERVTRNGLKRNNQVTKEGSRSSPKPKRQRSNKSLKYSNPNPAPGGSRSSNLGAVPSGVVGSQRDLTITLEPLSQATLRKWIPSRANL